MNPHRLTESASRAIKRAAKLAGSAGSPQVEPHHLLQALFQEESHASEILKKRNVTLEGIGAAACGVVVESSPAPDSTQPESIRQSEILVEVIQESRRYGDMAGRHADIGSEHLLWGLASVASPVQELLHSRGVTTALLADEIAEASGLVTKPLDVDLQLSPRQSTTTDHSDTCRILDAAANRAREGLRVVEDFVRFTLDDTHLTRLLKQFRHDLVGTLDRFDMSGLLKTRDTTADVGTAVSTSAESMRRSPLDVAQANFKRVEESLRTLEEFGKIVSPATAELIEQLRYRSYTLEKAALNTHSARDRLDGINLYLLVTERLCHHGSGPAIRDAIAAGAGIVQVREKEMTDRQIINHAERVREWTREAGAIFIMNDRADLTVITDADGVHIGQDELSVREARRIVGSDRLVGVSTHTIEQARQAVLDGADYIGVGPVFPSRTKAFDDFAGLDFVRQVAAEITLPWFAIGGIDTINIGDVVEAGATRVAVSSAICGTEHPGDASRQLRATLDDAQ